MYKKIDTEIIKQITSIVGEKSIITDKEKMEDYSHDEFSLTTIRKLPDIVVKPKNTGEIQQILKVANEKNLPVTARGGGTGLCGGCVPAFAGIVLSLENMNRILEIDKQNLMAVVESGISLMDFFKKIEEANLFFPPHPGDESATIGGVIATNAGGARAVKYGTVKNFVAGIEAVLPDGEIISVGGKLIKNSTGYSLLHLLIGSEGTLGIITKAVIRLLPPPKQMFTLIAPYQDLMSAIRTVPILIQKQILPVAVEFIEREEIDVTEDYLDRKWPCSGGKAYLMIIVEGSTEEEILQISETIAEICTGNGASDVFVADTKEKQENILNIRSQIYEALKKYMLEILDITVPPAQIANFVAEICKISQKYDIWLPTYGHAADGNVHTHIMKANRIQGKWEEIVGWEEKYVQVRNELHRIGKSLNGIISGEHGIGLVKKEYLPLFLQEKQIEIMKNIKRIFDPRNILNPGKIFVN